MDFGAFVEILPGKEGLVHISKLSRQRVAQVTDVINEGDKIQVKLLEIDKMGRLNLSYIDAIDPDGYVENKESEGSYRGGGGNREGGGYRDRGRDNNRRDSRRY